MKRISFKNKVELKIDKVIFPDFVSYCKTFTITLERICSENDNFLCTVIFKDYEKLKDSPFCNSMVVLRKKGAGHFAYLHRKRYGFYLGAAFALMVMIYLTSCIWVVDVVGNTQTSSNKILKVMDECGIGIGKFRYGKKISDIKNKALLKLDTLAWLWVRIEGTRAVVEVREKGDAQGIFARDECCNLVASVDGIITDMRVRHGRKMVSRGDTVSKGDLLVSGVADTQYRGLRYIHANGEIYARTWRKKEGEFKPYTRKRVRTGKSIKKISVGVFDYNFNNIFRTKQPFKNYDVTKTEKQMKIFENIYLPLTFTTERFYEIIIKNEPGDKEVLAKRAVDTIRADIESRRKDGARTLNTEYEYNVLDNGNIYVSVIVESYENIAEEKKIEVQIPEEETSGESN